MRVKKVESFIHQLKYELGLIFAPRDLLPSCYVSSGHDIHWDLYDHVIGELRRMDWMDRLSFEMRAPSNGPKRRGRHTVRVRERRHNWKQMYA